MTVRASAHRVASRAFLIAAFGASGGAGCSSSNSASAGPGDASTASSTDAAGHAGDATSDAAGDAGGDAGASPVLTGPITGGKGTPFTAAPLNLASFGYVEEEYFIEGEATAYAWVSPPGEDGTWSVTPAKMAHYKTRILVRRPTDAAKFNGTVLVEWLNVSGGVDADPDFGYGHVELLRSGFAYVGVSAQATGVIGGGLALSPSAVPLVRWDPARYGSLKHPGDDYAYDMFTQAAQRVRHPGPLDPLGGLKVARMIGDGESQSAVRMVTYANAIQPLTRAFDAFFIHSRFGGGALLNGFADAGAGAILAGPSPVHIRGDLTVPVFQFETETDVPGLASGVTGQGFAVSRQPDTERLRTWEIAGTSHADQYLLDYESGAYAGDGGAGDAGNPATALGCAAPNAGPQHWVEDAALNALQTWMTGGAAPASGDPLVLGDAGTLTIAQDAYGNALGGIRTAAVDVPIAKYSGQSGSSSLLCSFFGKTTPFSSAELATLYSSHDDYVAKVLGATGNAQQAGFILAVDGPLIIQEAESAPIPQ